MYKQELERFSRRDEDDLKHAQQAHQAQSSFKENEKLVFIGDKSKTHILKDTNRAKMDVLELLDVF